MNSTYDYNDVETKSLSIVYFSEHERKEQNRTNEGLHAYTEEDDRIFVDVSDQNMFHIHATDFLSFTCVVEIEHRIKY